MKKQEIVSITCAQLSAALKKKELSAVEAATAYLEQIDESDPKVGAYLSVTAEKALEQAKKADAARAAGQDTPLLGIPAGLKDNLCTKGMRTTCASRILENFIPPYSATAVEKLEGEGAVFLGKLNMDEFAMGSTTENSAFFPTHNPRDLSRVPGGSSGGSAAAVAANEAAFTLGSDTGGSIRQPAAFCGVVGMKPTYGAVSRYGLVAFASSLDQIGPLTKDVLDNALVLSALVGKDGKDATSVAHPQAAFTDGIAGGVSGMKIALPKEFFAKELSDEVRGPVLDAAKRLEKLGARVEEASLPSLKTALPAYYIISSAEASSNLARFDGVRYGRRAAGYDSLDELYEQSRSEGFGTEAKRRILLGTFALSSGYYDAYYKKALQARTLMVREYAQLFETYDLVLAPVAPTTAYRLGEKSEDPIEMYLGDIYTVPVNIAGLPALSLPCGESGGLPVGMQLIGKPFSEQVLYRAGYAFEQDRKGGAGK